MFTEYWKEKDDIEWLHNEGNGDLLSHLIVATPHGGRRFDPGWITRKSGVREGDDETDRLAAALHREMVSMMASPSAEGWGIEMDTLVCHLHRRYCDLNRERGEASFEQAMFSGTYDRYHGTLRDLVERSSAGMKGRILLVDLHGQSHLNDGLLLRFRSHRLKSAIVSSSSSSTSEIHTSSSSSTMDEKDDLLSAADCKERDRLDREMFQRWAAEWSLPWIDLDQHRLGKRYHGHTAERYGVDGVCAIQIEVGKNFRRSPESIQQFATLLAHRLIEFLKLLLK